MALSLSNTLRLADSIACALYNINQTLVTTPYSGISSILSGLANGSPSMMEDIVNFLDAPSETILLPVASTTVTRLNSALINATTLANYYPPYYELLGALETLTGGLAAFLAANTAQVAVSFARLFNSYAGVATRMGLSPASYKIDPIPADAVFIDASTDLAQVIIDGASSPLQSLDGSQVAPMALYYRIAATGAGTMTSPSTMLVTYVPSEGGTPQTKSFTPSSGLALGTRVPLGVSGLMVTDITVTSSGSDTGYTYTVSAEPPRTLSY